MTSTGFVGSWSAEEEIAGGADFILALEIAVADNFSDFDVEQDGLARDVELEFFAIELEAVAGEGERFGLLILIAQFQDPGERVFSC